ncbi:ketopantoate reductase family protein [Microlunatus parietis]|uniref:2-dehydropantoate 2-reductase n=1 Tax=Microlunatus parietis TaxID=682979 RepID=A0A7Y9IAJ4_9ACTN|nr:2-dehydropantoate 2-reductase N-terminal domain-containing protein [Microlunatus parietis]NYE73250.1 2-dehydropantoate 2-reductase [Microlunatus parietis]
MRRYIIIGAGAIGGAIGGRLTQAGLPTVLVARGDHLAALRRSGLRLRDPDADVTVPVTAVGAPAELELTPDDVLVLSTKTHQAQAALTEWVDQPVHADGRVLGTAGELLPLLTALNGVASERIALRYFRRVYGVCVWLPAVHLVPGEVIVRAAPSTGTLHVGRVPAGTAGPDDHELLAELKHDWERAPLVVPLPADVMPWKYRKLISNLGNIFQALDGGSGDHRALVAAAVAEARNVLAGAGIPVTSDEEEAATRANSFTVRPVPGQPAQLGGSTWQSLARGSGSVETDYLNGEIVRIANEYGLPAPVNTRVAALARAAARSGQRPGDVTAEQLGRDLGLAEAP